MLRNKNIFCKLYVLRWKFSYLNGKHDYPESMNGEIVGYPQVMVVQMSEKRRIQIDRICFKFFCCSTLFCSVKFNCFSVYLKTGLMTQRMCPNDARPTNSRMQVSAN